MSSNRFDFLYDVMSMIYFAFAYFLLLFLLDKHQKNVDITTTTSQGNTLLGSFPFL